MATALVLLALAGRSWTPVWVQVFPNEQACQQALTARKNGMHFDAYCVPVLKP